MLSGPFVWNSDRALWTIGRTCSISKALSQSPEIIIKHWSTLTTMWCIRKSPWEMLLKKKIRWRFFAVQKQEFGPSYILSPHFLKIPPSQRHTHGNLKMYLSYKPSSFSKGLESNICLDWWHPPWEWSRVPPPPPPASLHFFHATKKDQEQKSYEYKADQID